MLTFSTLDVNGTRAAAVASNMRLFTFWLTVGFTAAALETLFRCCPRSERLAKYNQLLRIEEELGDSAVYAGKDWRFIPLEQALNVVPQDDGITGGAQGLAPVAML